MGLINPTTRDRVRYQLRNESYGNLWILEPDGWEEDDKELARHKDYDGMFSTFSNSLKFRGDGADYFKIILETFGINSKIQLIKDEKHPITNAWVRRYSGIFDLSTYENDQGAVSVKFNSSGLEELLKARESEKFEIDRQDTVDGLVLPELKTEILINEGRNIFLRSTFKENTVENYANLGVESNAGNTRNSTTGLTMNLENRSHENVQTVIPQATGNENNATPGMLFFAVSDRARTLHIKFNIDLELFLQQYEHVNWAHYHISLTKYGTNNYNTLSRIQVYSLEPNHPFFGTRQGGPRVVFNPQTNSFEALKTRTSANIQFDQFIDLLEGESLAIECYLKSDLRVNNNAGIRVFAENIKINLFEILEDSEFPQTASNIVLAHELGERLSQIITNQKDCFKSDLLGRLDLGYSQDGEGAFIGATHGFWLRNFEKDATDPQNKFKPLTTSFKDFRIALFTVLNAGVGIDTVGFQQKIRIEKKDFFYNPIILVKLPFQIQKVKRSVATEYYYSGVEMGFEIGGSYEEAQGLDEYNVLSSFTTAITRLKNIYRAVTNYRADAYGKEFTRRKQFANSATTDTPGDQNIWFLDLKRHLTFFKERLWQDDFAEAPQGVFSPETATNLRFTPINLLRYVHNKFIASSFINYPEDKIKYASSSGNSNLITRKIGGISYAENGHIVNRDLGRGKFKLEIVEFDHIVNFEIMQQIEGKTTIDGVSYQNFYGLFEYINEFKQKELGYLQSVKPNKEGKFKMLALNRI